jgi:uncharacterized protein (DUF302 family)
LLLPCNVTVEREAGGTVLVRIADPEMMLRAGDFEDDPQVAGVAKEARRLLRLVAGSLATTEGARV